MSLPRRHWLIGSAAIAASLPALSWGASPIRLLVGFTDRRFNRMRPSIAPRKRHQAG